MIQDNDLTKQVRIIRRALEHIPPSTQGTAIYDAAANELMKIEIELAHSRVFIAGVRKLFKDADKGSNLDRSV